jgi:hypothetical protein
LTLLDLSSNRIGGYFQYYHDGGGGYGDYTVTPEGPNAIADAIKDMGAISSVNVLKNDIPMEQAKVLANILEEHPTLNSLCGNSGDEMELDISGKKIGAEGAIMLVPEIIGNGALTSLNLANNNLGELVLPEGWATDFKDYEGGYQYVFTHTDGTKQTLHPGKPEGIIAVADAIKDMRTGVLLSLDISSNGLHVEGTKLLAKSLESNQTMTSLNVSSSNMTYDGKKHGDMSGVAALADAIPCMGAVASLNLASNILGAKGAKIIDAVLPKCT